MGIPPLGVGIADIWAAMGAAMGTPAAGWPKAPPGAAVGASLPGGTGSTHRIGAHSGSTEKTWATCPAKGSRRT